MQRRAFLFGVLAVSALGDSIRAKAAELVVIAGDVDAIPTGGGGDPPPQVETVVEIAPGTDTAFGNITADGGLTRLFSGAKTGNTNGGNASKRAACQSGYAGLTFSSPKRIDSLTVYPCSDVGFWHSGNPATTVAAYARVSGTPAHETDGTLLGTTTQADATTGNIKVVSSDKLTGFASVWFVISQGGSAANLWLGGAVVSEIVLASEAPQVAAIISPAPLRVYQQTAGAANVEVNWRGTVDAVRVRRVSDGVLVAENATGIFPSLATGWYEFSLVRNGAEIDKVKAGVGDVYLVAGQSNAVSVVQPATWTPAAPPAGRVIISKFKSDQRHTLVDRGLEPFNPPLREPGAAWPYAGVALNRSYPVMFVNCASGNTTVAQWAGAGGLVSRLYEDLALYRPRAIIWLQGESDSMAGTSQSSYFASLNSMVDGANKVAPGTPWVVGINSFRPSYSPVRAAQQQVIDAWAHVHAGPDCDPFRNNPSDPAEYYGEDIRLCGEAFAASLIALGL